MALLVLIPKWTEEYHEELESLELVTLLWI